MIPNATIVHQKFLQKSVGRVTKEYHFANGAGDFAPWEQVSTVYLTLQPCAMANGQLIKSYKVKRDAVTARYYDELPKLITQHTIYWELMLLYLSLMQLCMDT
jgi:hypothetical protein